MQLIHFKEGVVVGNIKLPLLDGLLRAALVFWRWGYQLVVTSLSDGTHMSNSLHYRGYAADLRSHDVRAVDVAGLMSALNRELGKEYQLIHEVDHFHLEYDPGRDGGVGLP